MDAIAISSRMSKSAKNTRIGNFVMIRSGTIIGNDARSVPMPTSRATRDRDLVSLQSGCYITRGVIIEDDVFCGPRVITMNDKRIVHRRSAT